MGRSPNEKKAPGVTLEDAMLRTIDQPPELPQFSVTAEPQCLLADDEFAGRTQCVGDELGSCGRRLDVRVDVAGECEVERAVRISQHSRDAASSAFMLIGPR